MTRLEWRYRFAKQYAKKKGNFSMGWILSGRISRLIELRIHQKNDEFISGYSVGFPPMGLDITTVGYTIEA